MKRSGAFLIARKIFDNPIWAEKPDSWLRVWLYILGHVNWEKNGKFERGEGFFDFNRELRLIGKGVTIDQVRKATTWLRSSTMISTMKSTRGTIVKVLNYNRLQDYGHYKSSSKSTMKSHVWTENEHVDTKEVIIKNTTVPSATRELLDLFRASFKTSMEVEYLCNWGKDMKLFKGMLEQVEKDTLKKLVGEFFKSKDAFIVGSDRSVGVFSSQLNKLNKPRKLTIWDTAPTI